MSEYNNSENSFIIYERISLRVKQDMETLYCDCYRSFGWIIENIVPNVHDNRYITIKLKRNRKIKNRVELNELQRKCENALKTIKRLEDSKNTLALIVAISIGVIGTSFIAGAIFSFLAKNYLLHIVLALFGFIGWALPIYVYNKIHQKQAERADQLIERQYDIIYEACEKANNLLENI